MVHIAGGEGDAAAALRSALTAAGAIAVLLDAAAAPRPAEVVVINPGASWEGPARLASLELLYEWTGVALGVVGRGGTLVACGPSMVNGPGAGYPEYMKTRLALGHWARFVDAEATDITPVVAWGDDANELAAGIVGRLASVPSLRSAGATISG